MALTVVLIASTMTDARRWTERQPAPPAVIVVTPHAPRGAHGRRADALLVTESARSSLTPDHLDRLIAGAWPAVVARRLATS